MDKLKNKKYNQFDYVSRHSSDPYYYDTEFNTEVYGISQQLLKDTPWVAHDVKQEDNLDALALKYYNNPTYWWIIAKYNDIWDPFINLKEHFDILKIPSISSIVFGELR